HQIRSVPYTTRFRSQRTRGGGHRGLWGRDHSRRRHSTPESGRRPRTVPARHGDGRGREICEGTPSMRPVYVISGGITKFAKAHPDKDFRLMVKEAFDYALRDLDGRLATNDIDGSVISYFSDHFTFQLKAGAMVQDFVGLCPKPNVRIEGGGATGGLCFQQAWESVASGRFEVVAAMGFETMSHVETAKGNEFIALASDTNFDFPVGGYYNGYYAM